jgi:PKD repeat protein
MALNLGSGDLTMTPSKVVQFDSYSIVRQDENTTWQWSFSPQPQSVSDATARNPQVVFGKPGRYDVTLTVTTPAGTSSRTMVDMIVVDGPESVEDSKLLGEIGLKSNVINSSESLVFITSGLNSDGVITIHNTKGQLMHTQRVSSQDEEVEVHLPNLSSGIYIYSIKTPAQKFFGKFIIR